MRTTLNRTNPYATVRQVLPYQFQLTLNGKLAIKTIKNNRVLIVSRGEVEHILTRDDLDVHRRKMYEAALEYLKKAVQ